MLIFAAWLAAVASPCITVLSRSTSSSNSYLDDCAYEKHTCILLCRSGLYGWSLLRFFVLIDLSLAESASKFTRHGDCIG